MLPLSLCLSAPEKPFSPSVHDNIAHACVYENSSSQPHSDMKCNCCGSDGCQKGLSLSTTVWGVLSGPAFVMKQHCCMPQAAPELTHRCCDAANTPLLSEQI